MKQNEKDILDSVNKEFNIELKWNDYEYNRFDAEDKNYIVEIKDRKKYYDNTMIEFDKYSYNLLYAEIIRKQFIYAVQMKNTIYVFNITKLVESEYNFNSLMS